MSTLVSLIPTGFRNALRPWKNPVQKVLELGIRFFSRKRIASGIFSGMRFVMHPPHLAKILGTYEMELTPLLRRLSQEPFRLLINIGAAEGYYAVGMKRFLWPKAESVAFETEACLRQVLANTATANHTPVTLHGCCNFESFAPYRHRMKAEPTLIFIDVEGYEKAFLDPNHIPELEHAHILVEVHDLYVPDCSETLRHRFAKTHQLEVIHGIPRSLKDFPFHFPAIASLGLASSLLHTMNEGRPCLMHWFYLKPHSQQQHG